MNDAGLRMSVVAAIAAVTAGLVAGCTSNPDADEVAEALPDLSGQSLEQLDCEDSVVWGGTLETVTAPYVEECWTGSPDEPFYDTADAILTEITDATGAEDVSDDVCPEDALYDSAAVACRAAVKGEVMIRVAVALTQPAVAVGNLPDQPTEEQIDQAVSGQAVDVWLGTQPLPES